MKKKTTEQFIEDAKKIHGDTYDYSKVEYLGNKNKVCIICPIHGEFWQTPHCHLRGRGCNKCGHIKTNTSKILSTEEYIKRAQLKHSNKYLYDKTKYNGFQEDVIVTCPEHGDFLINAHYHVSNGIGCPTCAKINSGPPRSTTDQFIKKAKSIFGNIYDYSKVDYVLSATKVEIICPKHGSFWITPNDHLTGRGCPKCSASTGERLVSKILTENNYNFNSQYRININSNKNLRIDFSIIYNDFIYLIEYEGLQHYQPVEYFGGMDKFIQQQARDNLLREFVRKNPNYKLLEIDCRWDKSTIKTEIINFLKDVPTNSNISSKSGELLEEWNS